MPDGDGLLDEGFNGSSGDTLLLLRQDKYRIFHKIASMEIYKMSLIGINRCLFRNRHLFVRFKLKHLIR